MFQCSSQIKRMIVTTQVKYDAYERDDCEFKGGGVVRVVKKTILLF